MQSKEQQSMQQGHRQHKTRELVRLAVFIALITLQCWVPMLGYINVPPLAITYVHVTVIIATLWLGTKQGAIVGTAWGINSWIKAMVTPVSPINAFVLSSPLVSVLPRLLMPIVLGVLMSYAKRWLKQERLYAAVAGFVGSALNTLFVLGAIVLFKQQAYIEAKGITSEALWGVLKGIIAVNGTLEALTAVFLTAILYSVLQNTKHGKQMA